jgi:hypothetical protein
MGSLFDQPHRPPGEAGLPKYDTGPKRAIEPEPVKRRRFKPVIVAAIVIAAVIIIVPLGAIRSSTNNHGDAAAPKSCESSTGLSIAVDRVFQSAWKQIAQKFSATTGCTSPVFTEATQITSALLSPAELWLPGDVSDVAKLPSDITPISQDVVARTPVVAMTAGEPWPDLATVPADQLAGTLPARMTMADPMTTAASAAFLTQVASAIQGIDPTSMAGSRGETGADETAALFRDQISVQPSETEALTQTSDPTASAITTEYSAWQAANLGLMSDKTRASYLGPLGATMDIPLVVLKDNPATDRFKQWLTSDDGTQALADLGLRDPFDTKVPAPTGGFTPAESITPVTVDPTLMNRVRSDYYLAAMPVSKLVVLDTSSSMREPLEPAGDGTTKMDWIHQLIGRSARMTATGSLSGLMTFSTENGQNAIETVVPLSKDTTDHRIEFITTLADVEPTLQGGTPLYQAIETGYQALLDNYVAGMTNRLVVITDGRNEYAGDQISLQAAVDWVATHRDVQRPIQIVAVAVGGGADQAALDQINQAAGFDSLTLPVTSGTDLTAAVNRAMSATPPK